MLAAKAALAARVDALGEETTLALGTEHRAYLENRLKHLEEGGQRRVSATKRGSFKADKYNTPDVREYSGSADSAVKQDLEKKLVVEEQLLGELVSYK